MRWTARTLVVTGLLALATAGPAVAEPTGAGFALRSSHVGPGTVYFDGKRPATVRFSFDASRRLDLVIRVVRTSDGKTVRRIVRHGLAPRQACTASAGMGAVATAACPADGSV